MEQPNLIYIDNLSQGNVEFKNKLISIIKKEFPEEKNLYEININSNNFKAASESVHKIKHKISILGLEKSYELATRFENNLMEADISLKNDFDDIMRNIVNYIIKL